MELIKLAIADGDTLLREGLKRIFSAESDLLVVGDAPNELDAGELVERTKPDILLLDLNLPKRGAVPVLLSLREKHLPTKVFVLSLLAENESLLDTAKSGAFGCALKRTSSATIIQALRRVHTGEIWADKQLAYPEAFIELAQQAQNRKDSGPENSAIEALSKREFEILVLVARGLTNQEISKGLFISLRTVKVHLYHVFNKLRVNNRTQAALFLTHSYRHESMGNLRRKNGKSAATSRLVLNPKVRGEIGARR
jgi:DNA-binding NarL/FixJ family response regulator